MTKNLKRPLSVLLAVMMVMSVFVIVPTFASAEESPKVTLELSEFGIPSSNTNGLNSYSDGTYSINLYSPSGNYKFNSGFLLLGKQNAYLELPAFSFDVEKIVFTGTSGASGNVQFNVFVGDNAASTAIKGSQGTLTFEINSDYQSAGNVYKLKVLNAYNVQFTKIEIYEKASAVPVINPTSIQVVNKDAYIAGGKGYMRYITELSFDPSKTVTSFGTWFVPSDLLSTEDYATVQYDGSAITSGQSYTADLLGVPGTELDRSIVGISFVNFAGEAVPVTTVETSTVNSIITGGIE